MPAVPAKPAPAKPVEAWRAGVARLRPEHPIGHPTRESWEVFLADCRAFVAGKWAIQAVELGWDARALFGCSRDRPDLTVWRGALWYLYGAAIVGITDTRIHFAPHGRRSPQSVGKMQHHYDFIVPVWDARP